MKRSFLHIFFVLFIFLAFSANASTETKWQYSPENEGAIRLIAAAHKEGASEIYAGLDIKFKDKWKTYWKFPGDTGMPVTVNSERSQNIKDLEVLWPAPKRFDYYGIETWGYKEKVVLPIRFKAVDKTKPVYLGLDIKWAICDEICIFEDDVLSLLLKPGEESKENLKLINKYLEQVPVNINENESIKVTGFDIDPNKMVVDLISLDEPFYENIDLFIHDKADNFKFPQPEVQFSDGRKKVRIIAGYEKLVANAGDIKEDTEITLANGNNSVEFDFKHLLLAKAKSGAGAAGSNNTVGQLAEPVNSYATPPWMKYMFILFAAFLGGLILNIMPCVLPVLSIKVMSIIKHGDSDKAYIRKSFFATILGILSSFMLLAVLVVVLKSAGNAVSWGMQFQQPEFLIFLSLVITLFACNQFGFFEVSLPSFLGGGINKKIDSAGGDSTALGNFLTGAFATLLATPCTAPFLSTAIAFSLAAESHDVFLVFLFMGIGLAFPYILILIAPVLVKLFPKPGAWMSKVRSVLGVLLIITALWLVYVMASNTGLYSAALLLMCLVSLFVFLKIARKYGLEAKRVVASVLYVFAVAFVIPLYFANVDIEAKRMKDIWTPYKQGLIEEYVAQGDTVFVDVTADWCLTCKFNKARVTNTLKDFFDENNVKLIMADYTRPSKLINKYLEENGAYAIPFNKVYGPNAKEGIRLPEILSRESVINAVKKASSRNGT